MALKSRQLWIVLVLLFAAPPLAAHVGSPDVFYEGDAGPYHLFVTVRMPPVIPGVAEIQVRGESGGVQSIEVVPLRLTGPGSQLPPAPDVAQVSKDDPQFFTGTLWLMETGALQVRITGYGTRGKGQLSIPVASFAQRTLPMERSLAGVLVFFMLLLTVGAISIVSSGVRDADLDAGKLPAPQTSAAPASRWPSRSFSFSAFSTSADRGGASKTTTLAVKSVFTLRRKRTPLSKAAAPS
jgi:hypothetical protein